MEIIHQDRNGNNWRFGIDCTERQADRIRGALAGVRNMGNRDALSMSAVMDADGSRATAELYAAVENALLQGLAERFPAPEPQPVRDPGPQHSPAPAVPDDETAGGYWWENM